MTMSDLKRILCVGVLVVIIFGMLFSCSRSVKNPEFENAEKEWRTERDKSMKSETSWLTIAGLLWLEEGENPFGSGEKNKVKLPPGSCDDFVGNFILQENVISVISENTNLKYDGEIVKEKVLTSDAEGKPVILELNDLRMWVIKRGDKYAIRLRDFNASAYKDYVGLNFYKPTEKYKLVGEFVPYDEMKIVKVGTVIGTDANYNCPGYVKFRIEGDDYQLDAFESGQDKFFFIFKDETNGHETYGASRFMSSNILENNKIDLNFNRAYNPPCAYTPFATCPLPPPQNYLSVKIEAGEKKYSEDH
jgi:uncharacterized protein